MIIRSSIPVVCVSVSLSRIALSCQPKILICDEPTTALDVTIQAQISESVKGSYRRSSATQSYSSHMTLGVVANIADRVAVLYAGQIVEVGTVLMRCSEDPRHPYTWALLIFPASAGREKHNSLLDHRYTAYRCTTASSAMHLHRVTHTAMKIDTLRGTANVQSYRYALRQDMAVTPGVPQRLRNRKVSRTSMRNLIDAFNI